jgi:hypothetical protein
MSDPAKLRQLERRSVRYAKPPLQFREAAGGGVLSLLEDGSAFWAEITDKCEYGLHSGSGSGAELCADASGSGSGSGTGGCGFIYAWKEKWPDVTIGCLVDRPNGLGGRRGTLTEFPAYEVMHREANVGDIVWMVPPNNASRIHHFELVNRRRTAPDTGSAGSGSSSGSGSGDTGCADSGRYVVGVCCVDGNLVVTYADE